jgi:hypothetical protein
LIGELSKVNFNCLIRNCPAGRGQTDYDTTSIVGTVVSFYPSFFLDLIDPIGDRAGTQ